MLMRQKRVLEDKNKKQDSAEVTGAGARARVRVVCHVGWVLSVVCRVVWVLSVVCCVMWVLSVV